MLDALWTRPEKKRVGVQTRLFALVMGVFVLLCVLMASIQSYILYGDIRSQYESRSVALSRVVAQIGEIQAALQYYPEPAIIINPVAERLRLKVDADYVVITDSKGIRMSHPNPTQIGKHMVGGDFDSFLRGEEVVEEVEGTLGRSIRAKVPIFNERHQVVGLASVGFLLPKIQSVFWRVLKTYLLPFVVALFFGAWGALWLSKRIKGIMHNLEPEQILSVALQYRTVLEALDEAVLVLRGNTVQLLNPKATELLGQIPLPCSLPEVWQELADSHLWQEPGQRNQLLHVGTRPVIVNAYGMSTGECVVTFRDRAELMHMAEELTQVRQYTDLLRAQTHEFHNRLHTIAGLIQLGKPEEALHIVQKQVHYNEKVTSAVSEIGIPQLSALIIGKYERARELGVQFELDASSALSSVWSEELAEILVLVVGNLLENAFDAVSGLHPATVLLLVGEDPEGIQIEVTDNGKGVPEAVQDRITEKGVSSKGVGRGIGLYLVAEQLRTIRGEICYFRRDDKTVFQVNLPRYL